MRMLKPTCPILYNLCKQTVTVYRYADKKVTRTVYEKAFFDRKITYSVDKTGSKEANSFLLLIPGNVQTVFAEDKVFEGVGPEISTADEWRTFIPSTTPELVVVKYADPKLWNGAIVHTEAGG